MIWHGLLHDVIQVREQAKLSHIWHPSFNLRPGDRCCDTPFSLCPLEVIPLRGETMPSWAGQILELFQMQHWGNLCATLINSLVCWLRERTWSFCGLSRPLRYHLELNWISKLDFLFHFYFLSGEAHWIWWHVWSGCIESIQRTACVLLLLFPSAEIDLTDGTSCLRGWWSHLA